MSKSSEKNFLRLMRLGACTLLVLNLSACVEMVVGSAVIGTFATTDRRTFGAQTEDKAIALKGEIRLSKALDKAAHVNVNAFNRRALLTGEVPDAASKVQAEREIRAIEGVVAVINEIQIAGASNFSARSNDALITTKVKATLVDTAGLYANAYKIVTEAGEVYMLGRVTQREGQQAADLIATISGVRKVVKLFEYISEEELKAMLATSEKKEAVDASMK